MSYPTQLNGERYQVDTILHIFDLHACDLPEYYAENQNSHMPGPWSLIDENRIPHVQIAGQFTNWIPKSIDYILVQIYIFGPVIDTKLCFLQENININGLWMVNGNASKVLL